MTTALDATLERAMFDILRSRKIAWKASAYAPTTLQGISDVYRATGTLTVDNANSDKTIWSSPQANYAFRAWHDWHHVDLQAEFDAAGERRVHDAMERDLAQWWVLHYGTLDEIEFARSRATLEAENIGQIDYWARVGHPPVDQRTFAEGYLAAKGLL